MFSFFSGQPKQKGSDESVKEPLLTSANGDTKQGDTIDRALNSDTVQQANNIFSFVNLTANAASGTIVGLAAVSVIGGVAPQVFPAIIIFTMLCQAIAENGRRRSKLITLISEANDIVKRLLTLFVAIGKANVKIGNKKLQSDLQEKIHLLFIYILSLTDQEDIIKSKAAICSAFKISVDDKGNITYTDPDVYNPMSKHTTDVDISKKTVETMIKAIEAELKIRKKWSAVFLGANVQQRAFGSKLLNNTEFRIQIISLLTVISNYLALYVMEVVLRLTNENERNTFLLYFTGVGNQFGDLTSEGSKNSLDEVRRELGVEGGGTRRKYHRRRKRPRRTRRRG
jgi:hypothetical protein